MFMRYLGFLLLVWFPGVLHAQSAAQSCAAPTLEKGYFVPEPPAINNHGSKLTYACNEGYKPAVEGWWATITCQNEKWSHQPQCIDEQACLPPTIPHAKVTESATGWYENKALIRITCDEGYEPEDDWQVTTTCTGGKWSSVPGCKRSNDACGEPPQIPHAVIVQEYQEVFAADSEVTYECEDGYTIVGRDNKKSILCTSGSWDENLTCRSDSTCGEAPVVDHAHIIRGFDRQFDPDAEVTYECEDGYTVGGRDTTSISIYCINKEWNVRPTCSVRGSTDQDGPAGPDEGDITTDDRQTFPAGRGNQPGTSQGGSTVETTDSFDRGDRVTTGQGGGTSGGTTRPTDTGTRPGHGGGSSGSSARPGSGGSSTTSGSDGRDSQPLVTSITHCGAFPVVPDGVIVEQEPMFLKYKCAVFYKLVGSETVTCYSDGSWSELPVCEEAFCILEPGQYLRGYVRISAKQYLSEGQNKISCIHRSYSATAQCRNGEITFTRNCCYDPDPRYCY